MNIINKKQFLHACLLALTLPVLSSCSLMGKLGSDDSNSAMTGSIADGSCKKPGSASTSSAYSAGGKKYSVIKNVTGFQSSGMAEIYGNKEQGSLTAGCESFDMNGFTAAHRSLPLPTHVKITNKNNNQSVVIKVNDRGPQTGKSIIQVTPAVANLLGASASFPAHIEAITAANLSGSTSSASVKPTSYQSGPRKMPTSQPKPKVDRSNLDRYYIVVGTYPSQSEAFDRFVRLSSIGLSNAAMETRKLKGKTLHMVRLGPYYNQDEIDVAKDRLRSDGLVKFNVVKN